MKQLLAAMAMVVATVVAAPACTTFCMKADSGAVFGQNYDWDFGSGLVVVNKRGATKTSFQQKPSMTWTSRFGSVTFNQYGTEFPVGGMNERGLVVATMWLNETSYAAPDARPGLNILQWIQYQLDTHASVEEVVADDARVRIAPYAPGIGLHYLVADAAGDVAAIEVLEGKTIVRRGKDLPVPVLANSTYDDSVTFLKRHAGFGGTAATPPGIGSLARFTRAAQQVQSTPSGAAPQQAAMSILQDVSDPKRTQWSIVYSQKAGKIEWRTGGSSALRVVDFKALDFSCQSPRMVLEVHAGEGDVAAQLQPYTAEANLRLVTESFSKTERGNLNQSPPAVLKALSDYAGSVRCEGAAPAR